MTITVIVNGANGRMGQETVAAIQADPELSLVGALTHADDLADKLRTLKPDVVVDFTTPQSVFHNTKTIIDAGIRPVIGTSGLTIPQITELQDLCERQRLGGIIAPNFSIGAILMMRMAQLAAPYFPDAEIIEYHHTGKKDAPSGTALKTAQLIGEYRKGTPVEKQGASRGVEEAGVTIHSVRLPGFVAAQTVIFGGDEETLTIEHHSTHRKSFMPGVRLACKKVMSLHAMVYGLDQLL